MHLTTRIALAPLVLSRTTRDDGTLLSIAFDAGRLRGGPLPSRVELRLDASELGWGGALRVLEPGTDRPYGDLLPGGRVGRHRARVVLDAHALAHLTLAAGGFFLVDLLVSGPGTARAVARSRLLKQLTVFLCPGAAHIAA